MNRRVGVGPDVECKEERGGGRRGRKPENNDDELTG